LEVEWLAVAPELRQEGEEEPTHAGIDVAEDATFVGQRGNIGDGVDHAMGIGGCRTDHHDGGVRTGIGQRIDVDPEVGAHRDTDQLDVEVVRRLGEGGMGTLARHDPGVLDAPILPGHVARRLDGLEKALGATGREVALHTAAAGRFVGAEQRGRVAHNVVLHGADAGKRQHVEPVFRAVQRQGVRQELMYLVAGRVDQAEDPATPPILITLLHGQEPGQDVGAGQALPGYRGVRELVHQRLGLTQSGKLYSAELPWRPTLGRPSSPVMGVPAVVTRCMRRRSSP
jgi:hypothetical protein